VTEIPALRDALVRAGERRRRRRRAVRASVPTFAVAAAAVLVFALPRTPDRERVVEPSVSPLARSFSVFARPQTADDRAEPPLARSDDNGMDLDPGLTRFLGGDMFALATRDQQTVCLRAVDGTRVAGRCDQIARVRDDRFLVQLWTDSTLAALVPNGTIDAVVAYRDGNRVDVPIRDNAIVVPLPDEIVTLSWTSPSGMRRVLRVGQPSRRQLFPRCPAALGTLPADAVAQAAWAALTNADRLSPGTTTARVTGARKARASTPCSAKFADRTVVVDLRLDDRLLRVFVGVAGGDLVPYAVNPRP